MKTYIVNFKENNGDKAFITGQFLNSELAVQNVIVKESIDAENIISVIDAGVLPTKENFLNTLSEILVSDGIIEAYRVDKLAAVDNMDEAIQHAIEVMFGVSYREIDEYVLSIIEGKKKSPIDEKTKVLFLYEKDSKDVFAYFPEEKADHRGNFTCYAHIGQHSACHPDYANSCKEAGRNEYRDLLIELIGQGYNNLSIINKK